MLVWWGTFLNLFPVGGGALHPQAPLSYWPGATHPHIYNSGHVFTSLKNNLRIFTVISPQYQPVCFYWIKHMNNLIISTMVM